MLLFFQEITDAHNGTAGHDVIQPAGIGFAARTGDDLNRLAGFQRFGQRVRFAVDAHTDAAVTNIGMYRIGKIDGVGANRQFDNFAFGRKDIQLIRVQFCFDVFNKIVAVTGALLNFQQALHPAARADLGCTVALFARLFVFPVCGDAVVGHLVHIAGAHLDLDRNAMRAHQRGM